MATPFPIENNIPLPPKRTTAPRPAKNGRCPFAAMEIGGSFLAPLKETRCGSLKLLKQSIHQQASQHPDRRFTLRIEANGVRCWRIA